MTTETDMPQKQQPPQQSISQEVVLLNEAFGSFREAADTLSGFYDRLTGEMRKLNLELEEKNRALCASLTEQEQTRTFLSHLLDNLTTGVVALSPEGRVTLANRVALHLMGPSVDSAEPGELLGPLLLPDDVAAAWRQGAAPHGQSSTPDLIVTKAANGRLLAARVTTFPWPDQPAGRTGLIALLEDVTNQAIIGAQRERTQTLSAMGEMAAEIAHQLRTPLASIELFASLLGREAAGDENQIRLVEHILSGVKQVNHLISNYLTLDRPTRPDLKPVNLDRLLDEALDLASQAVNQAGLTVTVRQTAESTLAAVDPALMLQVFLNIILNAIEGLEKGGGLEVILTGGRHKVTISFQDNGRGIAPLDLNRVFNPFFTTKDQNLGLGLAVSHRIVDAHKGLIQIKSPPGRGTLVTVTLPAWKARRKKLKVIRS